MATLKCSYCGDGIHYHDEADLTQYILFEENVWNRLIESELPTCRYTIDSNEMYYIIWRCKKCGTLHMFEQEVATVNSVYIKIDEEKNELKYKTLIMFSDKDWDVITEEVILGTQIAEQYEYIKPFVVKLADSREQFVIQGVYQEINGVYKKL